MWTKAPAWLVIIRDVLCFLVGLAGMAYLIVTDSQNIALILAALSMAGIPGVSSVLSIMTGQTVPQERQNSPSGITGPSSPSPLGSSDSQSS